MSDPRPVGVFDSGIGGVTVLREIQRQLPTERCLYVADSRENPYGTKPVPYIQQRCERIVDYLLDHDAKLVVVACNAASVSALAHLRERYPIKFVGTVPAVKPAAQLTKTGKIGVLATPTTAASEPLAQLIEQFTHGVTVMTQPCPGLVPLIEDGIVEGPEIERLLRSYLATLLEADVDVIVLGCTHYPFLRDAIARICGPGVLLVDPAEAVARQLGRVLEQEDLANPGGDGGTTYVTTGDLAEFELVLRRLAGPIVGAVRAADI
jgi:glutamate racemase